MASVNRLIRAALTCPLPDPRVAYGAPTFRQAKRIAWDYAKRYSAAIPGAVPNEVELRIDYPNGGRLMLLGQDSPDSLRGSYYDDFVADEYQMWSPRVYGEIIRPALVDRKGRIAFSGTPAGTENPLYEIYERLTKSGSYTRIHKASETGIVDPEELAAAKREMTDEQYAQEFECSWTGSIIGAIYGKALAELEEGKRLTRLPILPNVPVDVVFDLGRGDATALWFIQEIGPEIRLVDHYENNGHDITHYVAEMEKRRQLHGFQWGMLVLPHDSQHRHMTGESVNDTLQGMRYSTLVCPSGNPTQEIHSVRLMFRSVWIDSERCAQGVRCIRNYRYEYNEERKSFYDRPVHDWTSHTCDALRVYAINRSRIPRSGGWGTEMPRQRLSIA